MTSGRLAIILAAAVVGCGRAYQRPAIAALAPPPDARELSRQEQVAHVLSRLTFGARPGDADRVAAMGVDAWIDNQLRPDSIADSAAVTALRPLPLWTVPISGIAALAAAPPPPRPAMSMPQPPPVRTVNADGTVTLMFSSVSVPSGAIAPNDQVTVGKVIRAEMSERQVLEVITDFWENHFSVYSSKMPSRDALMSWDREVLRPRALGKFRDLLGAVAHSPAMLFYLDNQLSERSGINENYARELMELHTLGVDGGYTQQDVIQVARALTGWSIYPVPARAGETGPHTFFFRASVHDSSEKTILGHTLAAGRGQIDGEDVLDILARHPSTAHFISYKLARHLVSDDPPAALVDRAAATFMRTDGDIAQVVRTIITSPEFFSRAAFRAKVKTPFELVVSARRALGAPPDTTLTTKLFISHLGQVTFGRLTPDGWPDRGEAWINSGSIKQRMIFGSDAAAGKLAVVPVEHWRGWRLLNEPVDRQTDGVIRLILGGIAAPATRQLMLATAGDSEPRLRELMAIALGSPEFQRR